MKLKKHPDYDMFYVQWPDGGLSDDFYNKTRAKWYAKNLQWDIHYRGVCSEPETGSTAI